MVYRTSGERVLVAYFDVLGFGTRTRTPEDAEALYDAYRLAFVAALQSTYHAQSKKDGDRWQHPFDKLLRPSVFSDSVFLISTEVSEEASLQLQQVANEMVGTFLLQGLPVTGAIGVGEVWWDVPASIRLGPGITTTYLLAESLDVVGMGVTDDVPGPVGKAFTFPRKHDSTGNPQEPVRLRVPTRSFEPTQYDCHSQIEMSLLVPDRNVPMYWSLKGGQHGDIGYERERASSVGVVRPRAGR